MRTKFEQNVFIGPPHFKNCGNLNYYYTHGADASMKVISVNITTLMTQLPLLQYIYVSINKVLNRFSLGVIGAFSILENNVSSIMRVVRSGDLDTLT